MSPSENAKFLPLFRRNSDTTVDVDREDRRTELIDAVSQLAGSVDNLVRVLRRAGDDIAPL
jgi:hypothetical protein